MKTAQEVLEIVKDLNSRFLGKYYEGELIVAVDLHRGVNGFSICNLNKDNEVEYFKGFKLSEIDAIEVSDTPPADFKYWKHEGIDTDMWNITSVLIDIDVIGETVHNKEEATSYEDLKKLLKEKL